MWQIKNNIIPDTTSKLFKEKDRTYALCQRGTNLEISWSVFSRIRTEYGEIRSISRYSVRMRENTDQNNLESEHIYTLLIFLIRVVSNAYYIL